MRSALSNAIRVWRGLPRSARLGLIAAAALALLVTAAITALHGAPGRWIAMAALNGRELPGAGRIELTGVRGDMLAHPRIAHLTLSDAEGVWLEAHGVSLDWRGRAALGGLIDIDALTIERLDVLRRPVAAPASGASGGSGGAGFRIILGDARIDRVSLAEGVAGPAALLRIDGALSEFSATGGRARLAIERLDAPGDHLNALLTLTDSAISGEIEAQGAAGGPLAALLRLPDRDIALTAALSGDRHSGGGRFDLTAGGEDAAAGDLAWTETRWNMDAIARPDIWSPDLAETLTPGGGAALAAEGALPGFSITRLDVSAPDVRARISRIETGWQVDADVSGALIDRFETGPFRAGSLSWAGQVETQGGLSGDGVLTVSGPVLERLSADAINGALNFERLGSDWRIDTALDLDQPRFDAAETSRAAPDLGESARLTFTGAWRSGERRLDIEQARIWARPGELRISGRIDLAARRILIDYESAITDIASLTDRASGPVSATGRIDGPFDRAGLDISAQVEASQIELDPALAPYAGNLSAAFDIRLDGAAWNARRIHLQSDRLSIEASGVGRALERWRFGGDAALAAGFRQSGLSLDGALAAAFEVEGGGGPIAWRIALATPSADLGGRRLDSPRLEAEGDFNAGALEGDWRFGAQMDGEALSAYGAIAHEPGASRLEIEQAELLGLTLSGEADYEGDRLAARSRLRPAGETPSWALRVDYEGQPDAVMEGDFDARLETLATVRVGGIDLVRGMATATGPLSDLALSLNADGWMKERFELSARGDAAISPDGVSLRLSPQGAWGEYALTSEGALTARAGRTGQAAAGRLRLNGGALDFDYRAQNGSGEIAIEASHLPVRLVSDLSGLPPLDGRFDVSAELDRTGGVWTGAAQASADAIRAADAPVDAAARLDASLTLTQAAASLTAAIDSELFSGALDLERGGRVSRPSDLLDAEAPLSGRFRAEGRLANLSPVFLRGDRNLTGRISSEGSITGSRASPRLTGSLVLREGRFVAPSDGLDIREMEVDARLDNEEILIDRLSARDRQGGELSGEGRIDLAGGLVGEARLDFTRFRAVERAELDVTASGDAHLRLDNEAITITGEARIDRLDARPAGGGGGGVAVIDVEEINLPPDREPGGSGRSRPIRFDYRVSAANGLYATGGSFDTEWSADLHLTGTSRSPELAGEMRLLAGTAYVFNRRFVLQRDGAVMFDGPVQDATLSLSAVHSRADFTATARISGEADSPEITLSSTPALPQDEILARLLFDRSSNQLTAFETAQLASQLSGGGLLTMIGRLRAAAGVDRLDIEAGENGGLAVTGGRRFGDDVYVELQSSGTELAAAQVEWTLTPDLSLLSRLTGDTRASVSIRWRTEY